MLSNGKKLFINIKLVFVFIIFLCFLTPLLSFSENLPEGMYAKFQTDKGIIVAELYYKITPLTVINFAGLSEGTKHSTKTFGTGFYDGVIFHRVIKDFMIQGGDPKGTGRGGPGYMFPDEFHKSLKHDSAGILSMANAGPGTNGSQFFITHRATPWLNYKHSVFGKVIKGQDVVNKIRKGDKIIKLSIIRIGKDAQNFKTDQESFDNVLKNFK